MTVIVTDEGFRDDDWHGPSATLAPIISNHVAGTTHTHRSS